jgi:hypothetical protein
VTLAPGSSLIRGGPWSAAAEVLGLMRKDGSPVSVRIVILVAVLWVPLVLLAYAQSGADMAFRVLQDFVVWSRLLVAVPLLLFSEPVVDRRVTIALETIRREGLVGPDSLEAWNEGIRKAHRFASGIVPLLSIAIVSIAMVASHFNTPLQATSVDWMHVSGGSFSWAGLWYTALGRPFYLFLLLLWIWRWASIALLLIRVSRLPLRLMVSHPDRVGGLGVLGEVPPSASGVIVAMGAVVAAQFAWEMLSQGTSLRSLAPAIGAFAVATLIFTVGPLFFLTPQLLQLQRKALVQFGILAARHSSRFEGRWMEEKGTGTEGKDEEIVGAPDFSSLIDLGSSYDVARSIRTMPFRPSIVKGILAAALIPMIPLVFMEFQLEEILTRLAKIIL